MAYNRPDRKYGLKTYKISVVCSQLTSVLYPQYKILKTVEVKNFSPVKLFKSMSIHI